MAGTRTPPTLQRTHSIVDDLLDEINDTLNTARRCSVDSDVCYTDCSMLGSVADSAHVGRYRESQLAMMGEHSMFVVCGYSFLWSGLGVLGNRVRSEPYACRMRF